MYTSYFDRLFLNIKIWLIAVAINALLLSLYLGALSNSFRENMSFIGWGFVLGGIFSFPVLVALQITLKYCISSGMTGKRVFRTMQGVGMVGAVIAALLAGALAELKGNEIFIFLGIGLLSGTAAISSQYKRLLKWGSDYNNPQKYSHEN